MLPLRDAVEERRQAVEAPVVVEVVEQPRDRLALRVVERAEACHVRFRPDARRSSAGTYDVTHAVAQSSRGRSSSSDVSGRSRSISPAMRSTCTSSPFVTSTTDARLRNGSTRGVDASTVDAVDRPVVHRELPAG